MDVPGFAISQQNGGLRILFENCGDEFATHFQPMLIKFVGKFLSARLFEQIRQTIYNELCVLKHRGFLYQDLFGKWTLNCGCGCIIQRILES